MRVLITGGGTGGHVTPALAIAENIKQNEKEFEIAFVGTKNGIENRLVGAEGYKIYHVKVKGIRRSLSPANIVALFYAVKSPHDAKKIIKEFKPDVVIGTGGYVCWPILKAASKMHIPTMVHESNAIPGLAVKMLQNHVNCILTNFEQTKDLLEQKHKVVCVGNPTKSAFLGYNTESARKAANIPDNIKKVIVSCGGSLGAERVNEAMLEVMRSVAERPDVMHIHATGKCGYDEFMEKAKHAGITECNNIRIFDFIDNMPIYISAADLVVSRAGAITVSELALAKKPAVLIPSPNVVDNHQFKNAKLLADAKAAVMLEERNIIEGTAEKLVLDMLEDDILLKTLSSNIAQFAREDANRLILHEIRSCIETYKKLVRK